MQTQDAGPGPDAAVSPPPAAQHVHFAALDGLRGVAALCVAIFHAQGIFGSRAVFPNGILAVDFFFGLSGFVLAYASDARLQAGYPARAFMLRRVIRLLPMILAGVTIGALLVVMQQISSRTLSSNAVAHLGFLFALGATLIPVPVFHAVLGPSPWPLDPPCWSLFFEAEVNLGYALIGRFLGARVLMGLIVGSAVLASFFLFHPIDRIHQELWLASISPRAWFSFFAGVAVWRLHKRFAFPAIPLWSSALVLVLSLTAITTGKYVQLLFIFIVFPLLIFLSVRTTLSASKYVCKLLGELSYPVYAVHYPILLAVFALYKRMGSPQGTPRYGFEILALSLSLAAGSLLLKLYDEPVRSSLGRRLRPWLAASDAAARRSAGSLMRTPRAQPKS